MPITKELTMRMDNRPGSLATVCRALANRGVNIMAFQSIPSQQTILVCIVSDNPAEAQSVLDQEGIVYTETEVVQVKLANQPGELARAASSSQKPISTSSMHTAVSNRARMRHW